MSKTDRLTDIGLLASGSVPGACMTQKRALQHIAAVCIDHDWANLSARGFLHVMAVMYSMLKRVA